MLDSPREENGWRDIGVVLTDLDAQIWDDGDKIGNDIIPFAQLFAGDLVCFDFRKDPDHPDISVWDHELSEEWAPHMEKVASSFEEFLGMLRGKRKF